MSYQIIFLDHFLLVLYVESNDIILPYSKAEVQIDCVTMYARQWKKMIIYRQLEDSITRLLVVNSNMGSPNVDVNVNFTSEISYKEDALQATIRSKEVDCSYVGNYTCLLVLPQESYKNTTSVHGKWLILAVVYGNECFSVHLL